MNRYLTMEQLLNFKTPEQRSPEWFAMRSNYLTSSDLGTVLGLNKYKTAEHDRAKGQKGKVRKGRR